MLKVEDINKKITDPILNIDTNKISDGYHTFGELYEHRIRLYIALCKKIQLLEHYKKSAHNRYYDTEYVGTEIIKSKRHDDGSEFEGWFIVQIDYDSFGDKGQISYHLPMKYWDDCGFIKTLKRAKKWDGHTSDDVLERLLEI